MAVQLNQKSTRNWRLAVGTGAIVVGAAFVVLQTFPHLKTSFYNLLTTSEEPNIDNNDDNEPVEVKKHDESPSDPENEKELQVSSHSLNEESLVDIGAWSEDNLKSWLNEVSIAELKSRKKSGNTNSNRKKSVLHRTLLAMALLPILSLFRTKITSYYGFVLNFSLTQFIIRLLMVLRRYIV